MYKVYIYKFFFLDKEFLKAYVSITAVRLIKSKKLLIKKKNDAIVVKNNIFIVAINVAASSFLQ